MSSDASVQEKPNAFTRDLERSESQPALPVVHRRLANPAPLGLLSFATSVFLISLLNVNPQGVVHQNVIVSTMIFFGGICQYIAGIMEFVAGNTFGATVFPAFGSFNIAYAMIFIPGTGILAAYSDPKTGELTPEFPQALALLVWAWFILAVIFTVGAIRSSWALLLTIIFVDIEFLFLAVGYTVGNEKLLLASRGVGFFVAICAYWAGTAGLWQGITPITVPTGRLSKVE